MEEKLNNPRLTQKQICKQLGFSDSTIKRYRDDIKMDSPFRRNNQKRKNLSNHQMLEQKIFPRTRILNQLQIRDLNTML